jgi:hypothetical protein
MASPLRILLSAAIAVTLAGCAVLYPELAGISKTTSLAPPSMRAAKFVVGLDPSGGPLSLNFAPNRKSSCEGAAKAETSAGAKGLEYRAFVVPPGDYTLSFFSSGMLPRGSEFAFNAPAGRVVYLGTFKVTVPRAQRIPDGDSTTAMQDLLVLDRAPLPTRSGHGEDSDVALAETVPVVSAVSQICTL